MKYNLTMQVPAHIKYIIIATLLIGASTSMISTTHKIMQSSKRLEESKEAVLSLKQEKADLEEEIEYKKTQGFIEKIAREKLNMILPGEEVYIYPESTTEESFLDEKTNVMGASNAREEHPVVNLSKTRAEKKAILQEWKNLLF